MATDITEELVIVEEGLICFCAVEFLAGKTVDIYPADLKFYGTATQIPYYPQGSQHCRPFRL